MFALSCSDSEGSSSGCSGTNTQRCEINATSTACGDQITMECFDGATPDATAQCALALEQADEAIYCCTNAAEPTNAATDTTGVGGSGGAGT